MRILIADDDSVSRRMLQGLLAKWGYEVISCGDGDSAWKILNASDAPRLALLDWMMPGQNGVEVCKQLRKLRPDPYTYVLLLTAKDAKENVVEGLEAGADDYLTKPCHPQELKARLRVGLRLLELEDSLVQARESMRFKATHDALTELWNRGAILETLDREISRSGREGPPLGVLMVDLDHFKIVNDTYGHATGDTVLREVTHRLHAAVRIYDAVGRYGGEEFLILLPGCDADATLEKGEQLRAIIQSNPVQTSAGPLYMTASFGEVSTGDLRGEAASRILQLADGALYQAKEEGRNRVVVVGEPQSGAAQYPALELSASGLKKLS